MACAWGVSLEAEGVGLEGGTERMTGSASGLALLYRWKEGAGDSLYIEIVWYCVIFVISSGVVDLVRVERSYSSLSKVISFYLFTFGIWYYLGASRSS